MLAEFDQRVLDIICDRTAEKIGPGLVSWSIGQRLDVANIVSRLLKADVNDVQASLTRLLEGEYLSDQLVSDDDRERRTTNQLALFHKAWLEYSRFDEAAILSEWSLGNLDEWKEWDGIDGSPLGGYGPPPFSVPLRVEVVRLPSMDYEVIWNNKVIFGEPYDDTSYPLRPKMANRIAKKSMSIEEFVCRFVLFLFDDGEVVVNELVTATREGWKDSTTEWADLLRWYWDDYEKATRGELVVDGEQIDESLVDHGLVEEIRKARRRDAAD